VSALLQDLVLLNIATADQMYLTSVVIALGFCYNGELQSARQALMPWFLHISAGYAEPVLEVLDPHSKYFAAKLYRCATLTTS